jgi:hypothetical protein
VFLIGMGIGFTVGGGLIEATTWIDGWRASLFASVALFVCAGLSCLAIPEVRNDGSATT